MNFDGGEEIKSQINCLMIMSEIDLGIDEFISNAAEVIIGSLELLKLLKADDYSRILNNAIDLVGRDLMLNNDDDFEDERYDKLFDIVYEIDELDELTEEWKKVDFDIYKKFREYILQIPES